MARFRRKSCCALIALALAVFIITVILKSLNPEDNSFGSQFALRLIPPSRQMEQDNNVVISAKPAQMIAAPAEKADRMENKMQDFPEPNYNVHAFYYVWYGNPQFNGKYVHWDHPLLPHWDPQSGLRLSIRTTPASWWHRGQFLPCTRSIQLSRSMGFRGTHATVANSCCW